MVEYVLLPLLLSGMILLGAAVIWRLRRHPAYSTGPTRQPSTRVNRGQDLLPESANSEAENGLAAFYAYQMAAGKIDSVRRSG